MKNTILSPIYYRALACLALLSCVNSAAFAQTPGAVVYNAPLVVGNNITIGAVSCAYDAVDITKGACTVKVSTPSWCVKNVAATVMPSTAPTPTARSGTNSTTIPCPTNVTAPFTVTSICAPTQPNKLTLVGTAFQQGKPTECKKRESENESDKKGKKEDERSKSEGMKDGKSRSQSKEGKDDDDKDDCDKEKSSDKNDERMSSSMQSPFGAVKGNSKSAGSDDDKKGEKKDDDKPKKDDDKGGEGSGGGGGSTGQSVPFQINAQLPCQVPTPT